MLAAALALACLLNWRAFAWDYLSIDEHVSFWIADRSSPGSLLDRSFHYSATPPLSFILQRLSLDAFGKREWALRVPAAASYLGVIVAVWWLGRVAIGPLAGGLAAMLLATHPTLEVLAVAGRPYSVGLLLGVLAMQGTAALCSGRPTRWRWLAWLAANLALLHTHYLCAALWAAQILWLGWAVATRRLRFKQVVGWWSILLVLSLSVAPGIYRVWRHGPLLNWTTRTPVGQDLLELALPIHWSWTSQPVWWGAAALPPVWLVIAHILRVAASKPEAPTREPLGWLVIAHSFRLGHWLDGDRWFKGRAFLALSAIWFIVLAGGLWLLGRYWLESLAAQRYLVIATPASALVPAGLLSMLRGHVAPVLAGVLLVFSWLAPPGRAHALEGYWSRALAAHSRNLQTPAAWRQAAQYVSAANRAEVGNTNHIATRSTKLVLVASGLVEMNLIAMYAQDPVFHDYVACRLGRMYLDTDCVRLGLPMLRASWTSELRQFYRQAIARACTERSSSAATPDKEPLIWLVTATDTDLLRATAAEAEALLRAAGATEHSRLELGVVTAVSYSCPKRRP